MKRMCAELDWKIAYPMSLKSWLGRVGPTFIAIAALFSCRGVAFRYTCHRAFAGDHLDRLVELCAGVDMLSCVALFRGGQRHLGFSIRYQLVGRSGVCFVYYKLIDSNEEES